MSGDFFESIAFGKRIILSKIHKIQFIFNITNKGLLYLFSQLRWLIPLVQFSKKLWSGTPYFWKKIINYQIDQMHK